MRNTKTQPKSELKRSKKRSFAGVRSGTFGTPKGKEKRKEPQYVATNAQRQPLGNGSETAKHHLNPSSGEAKNGPSQGCEVAPLEPLKEKKRAPVRRQKTWRNLAWTNAKRQPIGNGCETAKHNLNPSSGEAKNGHSQGCEVAPLEPLKEKKRAPYVDKKRDTT